MEADQPMEKTMARAMFGAGCFWSVEEAFRAVPGVTDVTVGYSGGARDNPTYDEVCTGMTGHAEVVEVEFDDAKVDYETLLETFWKCHDPTQLNFQGPDIGTQYRSVIFTRGMDQADLAMRAKKREQDSRRHRGDIVTEISPAKTFWPAEDEHQGYLARRRQPRWRLFG
jgi:peptide-methionine (S)-S-oxide reductase